MLAYPDDYANGGLTNSMPSLSGVQNMNAEYETNGAIESNQIIGPGVTVDYDSGASIELKRGFEILTQTTFHAFIDGCKGSMLINHTNK